MKVIVLTPVFNGETTIKCCIESVRNQDYENVEHIIIDGASTDNTIDILNRYSVKYFSERDAGIYDAFNKGLIKANHSDIIHILNADDYYAANDIISKVIAKFKQYDCELIHGHVELIDINEKIVKKIGENLSKKQLLKKMRVAHPSVFVRRAVYDKYGGFSVGFKIAADYEFLLRVWDKVKIVFIPQVFVKMRLGGISSEYHQLSYREAMAAAILNGSSPTKAFCTYSWEMLKMKVFSQKYHNV